MSASDLDMPLLPSSEQIRRREFATVRRGYDPQQVRIYLTSIAEQVGNLERQLSQLRLEADSAAARETSPAPTIPPADPPDAPDPYASLSRRFASLIEVADQEASRTVDDARVEAARMIDEARSEADRVRVDAQAHAEEARQEAADLLERARIGSERALSDLAERRRGLIDELEGMRSKLIAVADELAGPLQDALRAEHEDQQAPSDVEAQPAADGAPPSAELRPEDLWISTDAMSLPDLAAIDLDFDDPE